MKERLAALSLCFAMILVTVNMFLLFSATLLGVDAVIEKRLKK